MAFSSLARGHLTRRLRPSLSHLIASHHDRRENPSSSSSPSAAPAPSLTQPFPPADLRRRSRSPNLTLPLPFGAAYRGFSTSSGQAEVDAAAGGLSDAASSAVPGFPAPFPGEVAAAAAGSFAPSAAMQHAIDAVHSFTGLNWWASIALMPVLIETSLVLASLLLDQLKSTVKSYSMDQRWMQEGKRKLCKLFTNHGANPSAQSNVLNIMLTPSIHLRPSIHLSLFFAIRNMVEKVPSLKGGGAYWFTDLTTPDELYILPVLVQMVLLADLKVNLLGRIEGNPMPQVVKYFIPLFVLSLPLLVFIPKAYLLYWLTWRLFNVGWTGFALRTSAVRYYLNLPPLAPRPMAAQVPKSKSSPAVDSPLLAKGSEQSTSEPSDQTVNLEKKRRASSVITKRLF